MITPFTPTDRKKITIDTPAEIREPMIMAKCRYWGNPLPVRLDFNNTEKGA